MGTGDVDDAVAAWCAVTGRGRVAGRAAVVGGAISRVERLVTTSGESLVLKWTDDAPPDLYRRETEGLAALASAGFLSTPEVHLVGDGFLLLADLGAAPVDGAGWAALGGRLAQQHLQATAPRFGWDIDNYLGRLVQRNPWTADGHAFFAEHRILRYLPTPGCEQALTAHDRSRIGRLAGRLPELVPTQPASLLHGDLWRANVVGTAAGPAVLDPAVHHGWAEAELSMVWGCGGVPDIFYAAYQEVRPLDAGWQERMSLLHIREVLSMIAHFADTRGSLRPLRAILDRFS